MTRRVTGRPMSTVYAMCWPGWPSVANGRAEYYVWGSNLLNQQYDLYGYFAPPSVSYGAPARGRTLGVGVSYTY